MNIDRHHEKHAKSQITITSNFNITGIDTNQINEIMEKLSPVFVKLSNQYKFKYQLPFFILFKKYGEDHDISISN